MLEIVEFLNERQETISTMESATGGYIASAITNISGSSLVFKYGAVTYSNEYKIKMGVSENILNTYSVYSMECAKDMSLKISLYANADYGIGITGKINDYDPNNLVGDNTEVFISIYSKKEDKYYSKKMKVKNQSREKNKELIKENVIDLFKKNIML